MTKYKAGTIKVNIPKYYADELNNGSGILIYPDDIISHEPAPAPIVQYCVLLNNNSYGQICVSCGMNDKIDAIAHCYKTNGLGVIKVTITGNDFTVEKVTG